MLTARECAEQLHISVSTFYRAVKAKKYREGRKVSVRAVRWYPSDIAEKDQSQMAP
jgi:predicted DNA-binding transcriptional regulator AlpA